MWYSFEEEQPPKDVDVLVESEDGRYWVASRCHWKTCTEMHYQSDSVQGFNYVPNPKYWKWLSPRSTSVPVPHNLGEWSERDYKVFQLALFDVLGHCDQEADLASDVWPDDAVRANSHRQGCLSVKTMVEDMQVQYAYEPKGKQNG